jgi:hypothetical protein
MLLEDRNAVSYGPGWAEFCSPGARRPGTWLGFGTGTSHRVVVQATFPAATLAALATSGPSASASPPRHPISANAAGDCPVCKAVRGERDPPETER